MRLEPIIQKIRTPVHQLRYLNLAAVIFYFEHLKKHFKQRLLTTARFSETYQQTKFPETHFSTCVFYDIIVLIMKVRSIKHVRM